MKENPIATRAGLDLQGRVPRTPSDAADLMGALNDAAEDADASAYEELQAELASTQVDPRYEIAGEIGFEECSKPLRPA